MRMQRVESSAIHAYSFNRRLARLTVRFEDREGRTYRYHLNLTPPEHDGENCADCHLDAAAVMAAFDAAPSKGAYYNAVLRRGHFMTERAPNWRATVRVRAKLAKPLSASDRDTPPNKVGPDQARPRGITPGYLLASAA
jgi:hypothetical protein